MSLHRRNTQGATLAIPHRRPKKNLGDRSTHFSAHRLLIRRQKLVSDWIRGEEYGPLAPFINGVGLVRKLRETRVLCGFSRLEPLSDRDHANVQPIARAANVRWLPAVDVYGEGIFIDFRRELLEAWAQMTAVRSRLDPAIARFEHVRRQRGQPPSRARPRLVFLHTFAHALIKELTFSCGYGSSSLRERLYVDLGIASPMSGVLVYTASGDADGILGGLVAQGAPERLPRIIAEALRRATWCSNDPVCMESLGGQRMRDSAACQLRTCPRNQLRTRQPVIGPGDADWHGCGRFSGVLIATDARSRGRSARRGNC